MATTTRPTDGGQVPSFQELPGAPDRFLGYLPSLPQPADPFVGYSPALPGAPEYNFTGSYAPALPGAPEPFTGSYAPTLPGAPHPYTGSYAPQLPGAPDLTFNMGANIPGRGYDAEAVAPPTVMPDAVEAVAPPPATPTLAPREPLQRTEPASVERPPPLTFDMGASTPGRGYDAEVVAPPPAIPTLAPTEPLQRTEAAISPGYDREVSWVPTAPLTYVAPQL